MKKNLICINCPLGCYITLSTDSDNILSTSGNRCKRGEEYAIQEYSSPMRILTGNMKVKGCVRPFSVKTDQPIPKKLLLSCAAELKRHHPIPPIHMGDIVIYNILDTGANVIATQNFDISL